MSTANQNHDQNVNRSGHEASGKRQNGLDTVSANHNNPYGNAIGPYKNVGPFFTNLWSTK